jgi:hypothetical protein
LLILFTLSAASVIFYDALQYKFADEFIYHYGFLFTSVLTAALIYGTHGLHCVTPKDVEEPRLLKGVADLSYDAYLFHWPVYIICSALILNNMAASFTALVFTFILSALVYYGAERIFTPKGRPGALKHRKAAIRVTACAVTVSVVMGLVVFVKAPDMTDIETDFAVGYVAQDLGSVTLLERKVRSINVKPVVYDGGAALKPNLLPEGVFVAAGEAEDVTAEVAEVADVPEIVTPPDVVIPQTEPQSEPEPSKPEPEPEPTPAPTQTEPQPQPEPEPPPQAEPSAAEPAEPVTLNITGGVTVIGDSVSLGAQPSLTKTIPDCYVDSKVSRPLSAGADILTGMQNRGELREYVVIALGTNGTNGYEKLFTQIIDALEPGHRLIIVTPFDGRSNENAAVVAKTAAWLRGLPGEYDFVTIADWNAKISSQVNLLANDKVHMGGGTSMALYAECVAEAVNAASGRAAK